MLVTAKTSFDSIIFVGMLEALYWLMGKMKTPIVSIQLGAEQYITFLRCHFY
jgi:hypothetical protein